MVAALDQENTREDLKEYDQLLVEQRKGTVFVGLKEGAFWKFKPSYKYELGEIDKYACEESSKYKCIEYSHTPLSTA